MMSPWTVIFLVLVLEPFLIVGLVVVDEAHESQTVNDSKGLEASSTTVESIS